MNRDWNVIQNVLSHIESEDIMKYIKDEGFERDFDIDLNTYTGHIELLIDAGVIKRATVRRDPLTNKVNVLSLNGAMITMEGHDLLDALRDATLWRRIKAKAKENGLAITWEFIKAALPIVIKEALS